MARMSKSSYPPAASGLGDQLATSDIPSDFSPDPRVTPSNEGVLFILVVARTRYLCNTVCVAHLFVFFKSNPGHLEFYDSHLWAEAEWARHTVSSLAIILLITIRKVESRGDGPVYIED